jgi:1-acyl-sn-glycerol-3-phosphate acyltransferase
VAGSRALLAVPIIALDTLVLAGPALVLGLLDRSGRAAHFIARQWAGFILRSCGVRVIVEGTENLPAAPAVYAANHCSALDIPILFGHLPVSFRIIYKKSLNLIPFLGWYLFLGGHVSIDRSNPFKARRSLARAAQRIRQGTPLAVFPEGTRSASAEVGHFKRGSLVLSIDAGVPVVPVSLVGVKDLVPHGIKTLRPGTVWMRVHPPIPTTDLDPGRAYSFAEEVRQIVVRGCALGAA